MYPDSTTSLNMRQGNTNWHQLAPGLPSLELIEAKRKKKQLGSPNHPTTLVAGALGQRCKQR
jgi:hypothetical protein